LDRIEQFLKPHAPRFAVAEDAVFELVLLNTDVKLATAATGREDHDGPISIAKR